MAADPLLRLLFSPKPPSLRELAFGWSARDAFRDFAQWLLSPEPGPPSGWSTVVWWEKRRLAYNLLVGAWGLVCLVAFFAALCASGALHRGEDAVEPVALIFFFILIKVAHTPGWIVEVPLRWLAPGALPCLGPWPFLAGTALTMWVVSLPVVYWWGLVFLHPPRAMM